MLIGVETCVCVEASVPVVEKLLMRCVRTSAGAFHFQFWRDGVWVDVVVDDRLPTQRGEDGRPQLIYARNCKINEFWGALAEKAFAKLHGGYQSLPDGKSDEFLMNLTGDCCCAEISTREIRLGHSRNHFISSGICVAPNVGFL